MIKDSKMQNKQNNYKRPKPNTVGIVTAINPEFYYYKRYIKNYEQISIANLNYIKGTIDDVNIIAVKCGVGKVSAAMSTQILIDYFHPDLIINAGSAGAINKNLNIGDIVLATDSIQWDVDNKRLGNQVGYIAGIDKTSFTPHNKIFEDMDLVVSGINRKIVKGLVVSGDQFISTKEQKDKILKHFPTALCAEMEGASVGQVCVQNNIPFLIIRVISDNANENSKVDFVDFVERAGKDAFKFTTNLINNNFQKTVTKNEK